jgi:hypothetical protein
MNNLRSFHDYKINEGLLDSLGLPAGFGKVFAKALTDKFVLSISGDLQDLKEADLNKQETWIEPYKNIFRKSCMQFGGAKKEDVNKTCNKPQTLQKLAEHILDPAKGLINQKSLDDYAKEATMNPQTKEPYNPSEVEYEYKVQDIDQYAPIIADILKKTGISDGDIKKTGTYIIERLMPTMKKFYTSEALLSAKFLTDGKFIDAAKAKSLVEGGASAGGEISL